MKLYKTLYLKSNIRSVNYRINNVSELYFEYHIKKIPYNFILSKKIGLLNLSLIIFFKFFNIL